MNKRNWKRHRPLFASPVPAEVQKPKMKWRILPILWYGFKRMCFVLGAMVFLSALVGVYSASFVTRTAVPGLPDEMVLYIELEDTLRDVPKPPSFSDPFSSARPTVRDLVDALDRGAQDERVLGLMARMESGSFALAHIQELRAAIKRFREAGKFAYIYSSSYGGSSGGLGRFYLASVFEERWMQPMGVVSIAGLKAEVPFFRDVLDKIGVHPQFYKRKDYKTAYESITNRALSAENKEMIRELVETIRAVVLADMPADLGMEEAEFEALIDTGLFPAEQAQAAGLITHADYVDVLIDRMKTDILGDPESEDVLFINAAAYGARMRNKAQKIAEGTIVRARPEVALVYASGAIMYSDVGARVSPVMAGQNIAAAEEIAPAILEAAKDEAVKALVLRVDSPGGSPVASESILRAVEKVKEKGKPVIVSMGPTAASGGYWIAAYADRIFALPTTLTGSIGVVGGKFSVGKMWDKLGVNWDTAAQWGDNAGMWSLNTPFSDSEAARINAMLDQVYDGFIARVAKGRNMSAEEVDKVAGGRVWTGKTALDVGLVDQLGGLADALDYAAQQVGAENRSGVHVVIMPKPKTTLQQLVEILQDQGAVYEGMKIQAALATLFKPMIQDAAVLSSTPAAVYEPLRLE